MQVPFTPGRTDASQEMTDVKAIAVLEPKSDGFRNFFARELDRPAEELLDRPRTTAHAHRSRNDRAHRRHAGTEHQHRAILSLASLRSGRRR